MRLRSLRVEDVPRILEIYEKYGEDNLPSREDMIVDAVVEDDGKIVAYGQLKLLAEAMMFMDLSISRRKRRETMAFLLSEAMRGAEMHGIKKIYSFARDPDFALLLEKHFGFDRIDYPGELLIRRV